jgi:hypothetical protein
MAMNNERNGLPTGRTYAIEDVFEDFSEYQLYLTKALSLFQDHQKKRNPTLKRYVPEYLEVEFEPSIKAPRLYFPRYRGVVVVQLPSNNLPARKRAVIRERNLLRYVGIVKINELAVGDEFAMRMKLIDKSKKSGVGRRKSSSESNEVSDQSFKTS